MVSYSLAQNAKAWTQIVPTVLVLKIRAWDDLRRTNAAKATGESQYM